MPTITPSPAIPPVIAPKNFLFALTSPANMAPTVAINIQPQVGNTLKSGKNPATISPGITVEITPIQRPMFSCFDSSTMITFFSCRLNQCGTSDAFSRPSSSFIKLKTGRKPCPQIPTSVRPETRCRDYFAFSIVVFLYRSRRVFHVILALSLRLKNRPRLLLETLFNPSPYKRLAR